MSTKNNREIKFRAWMNDKMEYFPRLPFPNNEIDIPVNDIFSIIYMGKQIKWMQYTGLKDKNGKEIYEGDVVCLERQVVACDYIPRNPDKIYSTNDIVYDNLEHALSTIKNYININVVENFRYIDGHQGTRIFGDKISLVEWGDKSCGFEPFADSKNNCGHCGGGASVKNAEIIGNIYENPELLNNEYLN
jgi:ribosomal protein L37E